MKTEFERNMRTSQLSGGGVEVETMVVVDGKVKQIFQSYQLNVPEAVEQFRKDFAQYSAVAFDLKAELIRRYATWSDKEAGNEGINWVMDGELTQVSTRTAFVLARGGMDVVCIDNDCDYGLEVNEQDEHYPDKSKNYPEIETIFVVVGKL